LWTFRCRNIGTPRAGWNDNAYEEKALRRGFIKMLKRFEKLDQDENTDEEKIMQMTHTISMMTNSKDNLSKERNDIATRINELESRLPKKL
jgi:predicted  nucleic acid-binding Zn-ribbon protein